MGYRIDECDFDQYQYTFLNRNLIAKVCLNKFGKNISINEDNSYMKNTKEIIRIIKRSNGITSIAHPSQYSYSSPCF